MNHKKEIKEFNKLSISEQLQFINDNPEKILRFLTYLIEKERLRGYI